MSKAHCVANAGMCAPRPERPVDGGAAQHAQRAQLRRVTPRGTAATATAVTVCTRRRRYLALPVLLPLPLLLLLLLCLADLSCRARLPREQPARRLAPCRERVFPQLLLRLPRASLRKCSISVLKWHCLCFKMRYAHRSRRPSSAPPAQHFCSH